MTENRSAAPAGPTIRVVTYNVLANAYVKRERYPRSTALALAPAPRRARLLDTIAALDADVYGLQEVDEEALSAIIARLGDHYVAAYEKRHGHVDGCATLVRRSRLLSFSRHEALHYRAREGVRDGVALFVHLQLGARALVIANTHLAWQAEPASGSAATDTHVGRLQLLELLERHDAAIPWIVLGDFNATSTSVVIEGAFARGFELGCRAQRPWDTTNIGGRMRKIDYVLYTPAHLHAKPHPLPRLGRDTPMPSDVHASDHLPVRVDFELALTAAEPTGTRAA